MAVPNPRIGQDRRTDGLRLWLQYTQRCQGVYSKSIVKLSTKLPEPKVWERRDEVRRDYVRQMFDRIAGRYDLLNSIMSLGQHHRWRRIAVGMAGLKPGGAALDVCCGTGDFAIELSRVVGEAGRVAATDFSPEMLKLCNAKALQKRACIETMAADALSLPFDSETFDAVTVGFGVRNLIDPTAGFREMARVVKPGGRVVCLECSRPRNRIVRALFDFASVRLLPRLGALLSRRDAYEYLPNSIQSFEERDELADKMREAGLTDVKWRDLSLGVVCIHVGAKP